MTPQFKQQYFEQPYFEQTVLNAEPVELVRMLLQKAIACVREAREHLRTKRVSERGLRIGDAYACVAELHGSLRPEVEPALVARLRGLYIYMQQRLLEANVAQADAPLAEVLNLLTTLEEGWSGASKQLMGRQEAANRWSDGGSGRQPVYGQVVMA